VSLQCPAKIAIGDQSISLSPFQQTQGGTERMMIMAITTS